MKGKDDDKKKKKEQSSQEDKAAELDIGFGKFSLGGLLQGFGNLVELVGELAEKGEALKREGEFKGKTPGGKEVRGMYGFSISTLEKEGKPVIRTFGNIKRTPKGPVVEDVREPYVDVFDEKTHVKVIAELPGVAEDQIKVDLHGDVLNIFANGTDRKYQKEVLLPTRGKEGGLTQSFRSGILEILIEKAE